ncbi:MAG: SpvB/TcaC N-terminal domain-containing protein [bacterium]
MSHAPWRLAAAAALALGLSTAHAQTGVSDDRVSLPAGPGSLEGVGENVSLNPNMGVMSYGVPIEVPRGFEGLTPALRLAYSSGAGSSTVGVGWSLTTPHIERGTVFGLPRYGRGDLFTVDGGDELVELPGAPVPTYRARYEGGFVRYTWLDAGDGREGYWRAEYPDGRVATFGARADGTLVPAARVSGPDGTFRYMMVEVVDVYGHRMAYAYEKSGAVSLVRQIEYVFDDRGAARYAVSFGYEPRADETGGEALSDAKAGFDERLTVRLAEIDVFSGDDRIRRYQLGYERYVDSGGFTRLREVAMRGAQGGLYPAVQRFGYSRSLEGVCDDPAGCERPFVIDMGNIGVNIGVGRATLVDINGDALPDLVDTTDDGPHRFILNTLAPDGRPRFAAQAVQSAIGVGSGFRLGTPSVQVLDVDGDGFADLLDARNGRALMNLGGGDWAALAPLAETDSVGDALAADFEEGALRTLRFIDLDNDKRIDLMRSTRETTSVWRNLGADGFVEDEDIDLLGYDLLVDDVELADMNGDGLLDAVRLGVGGLRYKLNLGHGRWGAEVDVQRLPIDESELDLATLDDINGDGLADVVIVAGRGVRFALNRNGEDFAAPVLLSDADVDGELPLRDATVTVLMADVNGNGSTDVVWLDAQGEVTALELFPVRPNQLARVENSLGQLTEISYTTAVQQLAEDGAAPTHPLPHPMLVVDRIDRTDLLSGVRETTRYRYRDGYYDGVEKRFRGFGHVEIHGEGDATQEGGLQIARYDVGAVDPYRHGLLIEEQTQSDGRPLGEVRTTFEDCPLAEVPETTPAIRYICPTATETRVIEGSAAAEHLLLREETTYDGYGNVTLAARLGVVETGAGACAPCGDRGPDDFGAACGSQCRGDEVYIETDYITPGAGTDGRWILGAPYRVATYADPESPLRTESLTYYDGPAFEGLPLGALTRGSVTRTTEKVDAAGDAVIATGRYRRDAHGNVIETLDPLGEPGGDTHRSIYTLDDTGLRVVAADLLLTDEAGAPYRLRRELRYEPLFDQVIEGTAWMRVDAAGSVRSARRSTLYAYDEFGRMVATARPGDSLDAPSAVYDYALGSPLSRIVSRLRSAPGGALDIQNVDCLDGRGRTFQTRTRVDADTWQVSGFSLFNVAGQPWRIHQPYLGATGECDLAPPAESRFVELFRDATGRALRSTLPDAELFGAASTAETRYGPLTITTADEEDTDPQSPHADTPTTRRMDGLGRLVAVERRLADGSVALTRTVYDGLSRVRAAIDAEGNTKHQRYDLLGRVVQIDDPNKGGATRLAYDDAGNLIRLEDPRGVVLLSRFDGRNRLVEQWDEADRDATLQRVVWDHDPSCDDAVCSNTAGRAVRAEFPGLDGINSERLGYDLRGRQTRTERRIEGVPFTFELTYDNADRLVEATFPGGRTLAYHYDAASRLVAIDGLVTAIEYDDRGQHRATTTADGTRTEQRFDAVLRLAHRAITDAAGESLQALDYTRDRAGNLLEIEDTATTPGPDLGARYAYDAWYRTLTAAVGDEEITSRFDLIGNVVTRESSRDDTRLRVGSYAYDGFGPNALTRAGGLALSYDAAGDAVQRGAQTFEWDARGRLQTVRDADDAILARYAYDLGHRRAAKVEGDSTTLYAGPAFELRDGISTLYVKLGQNRLARVEDTALATVALTDLAPQGDTDGRIDAADAWIALAAAEGVIDAPEADPSPAGALLNSAVRRMFLDRGPEVTYLHHDHQGSIVMATDGDTGEVIGKRAFLPTGVERDDGFGDVDVYGFTGQEHDAVTGLVNFEHRLLDPTTGRWMSPDPRFAVSVAGDQANPAESLNVYGYVGDNYANVIDPDGLEGGETKKGGGATPDQGNKQPRAKANKAAQTLRKACSACRSSVKNLGKAVDWNVRRMAGDTTTMSTPELQKKVEFANKRVATLTNPTFVKRVKQSLAVAKAAKGAAETALGVVEVAGGDVVGVLDVVGGLGEVAEALQDLYTVSNLDPKNPADAAKLLEDLPNVLEMAVKHYEGKVAKYNNALRARTETQLLSTGLVPEPTSSAQGE